MKSLTPANSASATDFSSGLMAQVRGNARWQQHDRRQKERHNEQTGQPGTRETRAFDGLRKARKRQTGDDGGENHGVKHVIRPRARSAAENCSHDVCNREAPEQKACGIDPVDAQHPDHRNQEPSLYEIEISSGAPPDAVGVEGARAQQMIKEVLAIHRQRQKQQDAAGCGGRAQPDRKTLS